MEDAANIEESDQKKRLILSHPTRGASKRTKFLRPTVNDKEELVIVLYKYLPARFVNDVVGRGILLFRSLSYYQRAEDPQRGDPFESMHLDRPGSDVRITNLRTGEVRIGDFAYINRVQSDQIYCFCLSRRKDAELFAQFESDACIEICDVRQFFFRWQRAVRRLKSSDDWQTLHRAVTYFVVDQPTTANIKDPKNLPFLKLAKFAHQDEYRLVAARGSAFELIQEIVDAPQHDFIADVKRYKIREIRFQLGSLSDIARVHYL